MRLRSFESTFPPITLNKETELLNIWQPFPNTNNEFAYQHIADELFYGGKAGVGKSILLLLLARDSKSSLVLRREFPRTYI